MLFSVDGWKPELKRGNSSEFKRQVSRTDLKRQLSKQASIMSLADDKGGATEKTKLIKEETVETGNVSYNYLAQIIIVILSR